MLTWKPANSKDAVLQMQSAIRLYPREVDYKQCHYYVTNLGIAAAMGKDLDELTHADVSKILGDLGLQLDKEVYDFALPSENTIGYFVPEEALKRVGIEPPCWTLPSQPFTTRSRRASKRER